MLGPGSANSHGGICHAPSRPQRGTSPRATLPFPTPGLRRVSGLGMEIHGKERARGRKDEVSAEATWPGSAPAQIKRGTQLAGGAAWVWSVKDCGDYGDSTGPGLNNRGDLIGAYAAYCDDRDPGRVCHDLKL